MNLIFLPEYQATEGSWVLLNALAFALPLILKQLQLLSHLIRQNMGYNFAKVEDMLDIGVTSAYCCSQRFMQIQISLGTQSWT